jgi:hypothetical protein
MSEAETTEFIHVSSLDLVKEQGLDPNNETVRELLRVYEGGVLGLVRLVDSFSETSLELRDKLFVKLQLLEKSLAKQLQKQLREMKVRRKNKSAYPQEVRSTLVTWFENHKTDP